MKKYLFLTMLSFLSFPSFSQEAIEILKKTYNKCQSVQNGTYELLIEAKNMSSKDTTRNMFTCVFKKLKEDSIFHLAYKRMVYGKSRKSYFPDAMYTGSDYVHFNYRDSTATIMPVNKWAEVFKTQHYGRDHKNYEPLTSIKSSPLPHDSDFLDNTYIFRLIGEEKVKGILCSHIQVNEVPQNDSTEPMSAIRIEHHYWINKEDLIPIRYSIAFDMVMNGDTMYQYDRFTLMKYELNTLKDESELSLGSIPTYYKIKDYVPFNSPAKLSLNIPAPAWELPSLTDEKIGLKSLKGQVVLIDFFYKSCYPCMLALPVLQSLHEKYKSRGLQVIGIDPYDQNKDDLAAFLKKRGVTYTILLGTKEVASDYHVSGYPSLFLIDKKGNIVYIQEGYGKELEAKFEEVILKTLGE